MLIELVILNRIGNQKNWEIQKKLNGCKTLVLLEALHEQVQQTFF